MIRRKQLGALPACPPGQVQIQGRCVTIPQLPARYYFFHSETGWWCPITVANAQRQLAAFAGKPVSPRKQKEVASLQAVVAGTAPRVQHVSPGSGCVRPGTMPGLSGMGRARPRVVTMRGLGFTPETIGSAGGLNPNFNIPTISVLTFDPNAGVVSNVPQAVAAASSSNQSRAAANPNATRCAQLATNIAQLQTRPAVIAQTNGHSDYESYKRAVAEYNALQCGSATASQQPAAGGLLDKVTSWLNGSGGVISGVPNLAIAATAGGVGLVALAAVGGKRR